jgi:hypothetical protein
MYSIYERHILEAKKINEIYYHFMNRARESPRRSMPQHYHGFVKGRRLHCLKAYNLGLGLDLECLIALYCFGFRLSRNLFRRRLNRYIVIPKEIKKNNNIQMFHRINGVLVDRNRDCGPVLNTLPLPILYSHKNRGNMSSHLH